jgi:hypothetical protein
MHRNWIWLVLGLSFGACDPAPAGGPDARDSALPLETVRAFFDSIPPALAAEGPSAWLDFFEDSPSFFMASDGAIAFPDQSSAEAFLEDFSTRVSAMSLEWFQPRFEILSAGVVVVITSYHEEITMTDGTLSSFGGSVSGVIRNHAGLWRLQHLHWSSPVAPGR